MLNSDYKEMLQSLLDHDVDFLIVGAYAMAAHGYPRSTGDIDIWIMVSPENSKKVFNALKVFGAPLAGVNEGTFTQKGIVFQIGVAPRRIDIITEIDGVDYKHAMANKEILNIGGLDLPVISKQDLIINKKSTGRDKDSLDAKTLDR